MTAEKYVNAIIKKVKCGKEKRQEIKEQLLSDISIALEQGETLEEIINHMGSVQEMAAEFNENLSGEEHRKYSQQDPVSFLKGRKSGQVVNLSRPLWKSR